MYFVIFLESALATFSQCIHNPTFMNASTYGVIAHMTELRSEPVDMASVMISLISTAIKNVSGLGDLRFVKIIVLFIKPLNPIKLIIALAIASILKMFSLVKEVVRQVQSVAIHMRYAGK